jgi:hypothetical protein
MTSEPSEDELAVNEIQSANGTRVLFCSNLSRGFRQFDLSISMAKWEDPKTIAEYLRIYAAMLLEKRALVNNIDSLDN